MKACKDCLYGRRDWMLGGRYGKCGHERSGPEQKRVPNWWHGSERRIRWKDRSYCSTMRSIESLCGEDAKLFVHKTRWMMPPIPKEEGADE